MRRSPHLITALLLALGSYAWAGAAWSQFPSLGGSGGLLNGLTGGSSGGLQASPEQLSADLGGLSQKFAASFQAMLVAEAYSAKAMGLEAESEELEKTATYYAKGNVEDYDQVQRDVDVSDRAQSEIDAKMASAKTVDAAAKIQLAAAAPYYATGTINAAELPGEYAAWTSRAQASVSSMKSNPVAAASNAGFVAQVPKVAQLTAQLPNLVQKWITVTHNFLTFSQKHDVDTGDLASKIGNLQ